MMKITFKRIKIENFKNLEHLETEFGNKTYVYGANETGKTTFADAISYVLTGKNSLGDSQFEFIPVGSSGLSPRVEFEIEISDKKGAKTVNLVRMYEAKKKKDGEFAGTYQTVCYVNGLKIGQKEYDKWIEEHICKPEVFRLIHDVIYFTENISTNGKERPWEAQRRLLFSICGMKSDIDMAKSKKRFNELVDGLSQYDNVNQYLEKLKEEEKICNKQIDRLNREIRTYNDIREPIAVDESTVSCPICGNRYSVKLKAKVFAPKFDLDGMYENLKQKLENRSQICRLIDLCKNFISVKCKLAQKKVNEMLDGVQVEFFKKNKTNDELVDCCCIYWNGVPYSSLSYSTKFVVSMKIAFAFQKFYNVQFPILIDNAESINLGRNFDNLQMVFLVMRDECCPNCNGINCTDRKGSDGLWQCKICNNIWEKTLEVVTEE